MGSSPAQHPCTANQRVCLNPNMCKVAGFQEHLCMHVNDKQLSVVCHTSSISI